MAAGENLFDELDGAGDGRLSWAARAPYRPRDELDLLLLPRVPGWREDDGSLADLERIAGLPAVAEVLRDDDGVRVRLDDGWVEATGERLTGGSEDVGGLDDLAAGRAYAIYFWGANTTKALHVGHLRNLAVGNAVGSALAQAGGRVEHRSLICDVGRSMGEAMAGVVASGAESAAGGPSGQKSDHFVGSCYAEYVTASRAEGGDDGAEDSVARESSLYDDKADELMARVLRGDQPALELWSKTRAWVISGQRKTLSRLGVRFDEVIFESDFLPEVAELTNQGLVAGTLTRRYGDEMVVYETEREELEEMPLVRADGLPTQHMRALAYWAAAPELDDVVSLQVCGNEWVAHVTCRRQLIDALGVQNGNGNGSARGGGPPTHDLFHGMVARDRESVSSSKQGALLIDQLCEWLEERLVEPDARERIAAHPAPGGLPAQVALGYFLLQPLSKQVDFGLERLLRADKGSLGWDLALAEAHPATAPPLAGEAARDPGYRFAVVQSEMYRRHLGAAVAGYDVLPLSRFLSHFARWYRQGERSPEVERVVASVLGAGRTGLGLEGAR